MAESLVGTVTGADGLVINVYAEEIGGNTTFHINVAEGSADLRGFFFNYLGTTISTTNTGGVTANYMGTSADGNDITKVGQSDNNMNGTGQTFDAGLQFGTSGIGKDDIGDIHFTITGLTLSEIDGLSFGIRATSTGEDRLGSEKLVGTFGGHEGGALFTENFDDYSGTPLNNPSDGVTEVNLITDLADHGWTNTGGHTELGVSGYGDSVNGGLTATTGGFWLDTQNSPNGIDVSHTFVDSTAAVWGKTSVLSFDIGTQSVNYNNQIYTTDPNGTFQFKIDGQVVATYTAAQINTAAGGPDHMAHFDIDIAAYAGLGTQHTLELVDASASGYAGFAIDSIQIHDWVA